MSLNQFLLVATIVAHLVAVGIPMLKGMYRMGSMESKLDSLHERVERIENKIDRG